MNELKKILILDDEVEILELLTRILDGQYHVFTKMSTETFADDLRQIKPDVILIDHFIGDKTSSEIISRSLKDLHHIPIILHSAHEEIERISIEARVSAFLRKPSGIQEIRRCIAEVLERKEIAQ